MKTHNIYREFYSFSNPGTRRGGWFNTTIQLLYPQERDPVPIVPEVGWVLDPVWTGSENLDPWTYQSLASRSTDNAVPVPMPMVYLTIIQYYIGDRGGAVG